MPPVFAHLVTRILDAGAWDDVIKPAIREYFNTDVEEDDRRAMARFERFNRLLLLEFTGAEIGDLGLGRTHESVTTNDSFALLIKAPNRDDAHAIQERARSILIAIPGTCEYNRIEITSPSYSTRRGRWFVNLTATAYRSGRVRDG